MHRGDFIMQGNNPIWVSHELGNILKTGDTYTRLDVQQTQFAPHPVIFKHNELKTLVYVELMMGRSLSNVEKMMFERFRQNDKYGFRNDKGNLKAFKL